MRSDELILHLFADCGSSNTYGDLGASEARAGVKTHTIATGAAVHLNLTRVGLEALRRVFSGDTALNREATLGNRLLGQTELGKRSTRRDLNLCGNDVDTSNFLCE